MKGPNQKKDELWWIHPKFKAKQTFNTSDINLLDKNSYILTKFKNKNNANEDSVFPVGQGKYADFAKVLYKMNGYKSGPVKGWYVVICLEKKKKWLYPILIFVNLNEYTRPWQVQMRPRGHGKFK